MDTILGYKMARISSTEICRATVLSVGPVGRIPAILTAHAARPLQKAYQGRQQR